MYLNKSLKPLVMILGIGLVSLPVAGQTENYWYVGAGVGLSDIDESGIDDDDNAFKLFGGIRINKFFALEAAYVDLGELEGDAVVGGPSNELEVEGVGIGVTGSYPLTEKFSVQGKVGVYFWDLDVNGTIADRFNDDSDNDNFYGAGVSYRLNKKVSLIGEWERYEIEDFDIDLFSASVSYSF